MISSVKKFFASRFNTYLVIVLLLIGVLAFFIPQEQSTVAQDGLTAHFFYLPTCPHCSEQKPIITELAEEVKDVQFEWHDASTSQGSALFYSMAKEAGLDTTRLAVPTIIITKKALVGVHTKEQILATIEECKKSCKENEEQVSQVQEVNTGFSDFELPFIGRKDLTKWSLPTLAIVLGLIDGFNPCAMWVLMYLIALLMGLNDKKKVWVIVGSFVAASGILYFLFMTAWHNVFLLAGYLRIVSLVIGLIALGGGILSLKEYFTSKGALVCEVGDQKSHERTAQKIERIISQPLSFAIILSIIGLAFVVNSVEFVCSSAIPAVFTQILALSGISTFQHYAYIVLYTLFFMLDDLIIFGLAAFAVNSTFGERYAKYCRLIGGVILTILGILLVFAPHMLR